MNILYLAHRIPYPPNKGDKLRSYRQLEWLARHHDVWCAAFADDRKDLQYISELKRLCKGTAVVPLRYRWALLRGVMGLAGGQTVTETFYRNRRMRQTLAQWSAEITFDVVVAFSSSMAPYALSFPARRRVLDLCDLDSAKWRAYAQRSWGIKRWALQQEGKRLSRCEHSWFRRFDATILISDAEAESLDASIQSYNAKEPRALARVVLQKRDGHTIAHDRSDHNLTCPPPFIVGNGVVVPELAHLENTTTPVNHPPTVGFIGVMDYFPNVDAVCWFVEKCWPVIQRVFPDGQFRIVGRSPIGCIKRLGQTPGVVVVGEVTDVQSELARFDISVAPLQIARGVQNKVLEAMAAERAVVLTSAAATGLSAISGKHYIVADAPDEMAGAIIDLLNHQTRRREMGIKARQFVAHHYRWEDQLEWFEQIVVGTGMPHIKPLSHCRPLNRKTSAPRVHANTEGSVTV